MPRCSPDRFAQVSFDRVADPVGLLKELREQAVEPQIG
jgi:hypothetical protein